MKIAFLQDFSIFTAGGGAELSDRAAFIEGTRRGHDMVLVNPENMNSWMGCDMAIISNATRFPKELLIKITHTIPTVLYHHDYYERCHYRLFFPVLDKCKTTCPNKKFSEDLFKDARLHIFLSPLHREQWLKVMPELEDAPYYLHPSPINTNLFKPLDVERKPNTVLGINSLLRFKGRDNVIQYAQEHSELDFTFVGAMEPGTKVPENCSVLARVPNEELPGMYSQAEYVIHLPTSVDPFCRVVAESKLCGAKLIVNKLVGCTSYKEFKKPRDEFAKWIDGAPKRFWMAIEGAVK